MLAMLKMHLNTLAHSGNSCHLLGVKLFILVLFVRFVILSFSVCVCWFFCLSQTLCMLKLGQIGVSVEYIAVKKNCLLVDVHGIFSFISKYHACFVSC